MRAHRRPTRGFSLVELLTVMVIVGITAAISIPLGMNYVRSYQVMAAAQSVASQMQTARLQAVRRNAQVGVLLNLDYPNSGDLEYFQYTTLERDPTTGGWNPGSFYPGPVNAPTPPFNVNAVGGGLPSPHGPVLRLPQGYRFVTGGAAFNSLRFFADGSVQAVNANGGGTNTIAPNGLDFQTRIQNNQYGLTRTIFISRNGRVRIQ